MRVVQVKHNGEWFFPEAYVVSMDDQLLYWRRTEDGPEEHKCQAWRWAVPERKEATT